MALNIKNDETQRLSRELAAVTGENVTQAITVAVAERLDRLSVGAEARRRSTTERLHRISADAAPRWTAALCTGDHGDLLYDDRGLPR